MGRIADQGTLVCSGSDADARQGTAFARRNGDNPPTRYITVFGSANQIVIEVETDTIPEKVYAEATHNEGLLPLIVPGRTELRLLKKIKV